MLTVSVLSAGLSPCWLASKRTGGNTRLTLCSNVKIKIKSNCEVSIYITDTKTQMNSPNVLLAVSHFNLVPAQSPDSTFIIAFHLNYIIERLSQMSIWILMAKHTVISEYWSLESYAADGGWWSFWIVCCCLRAKASANDSRSVFILTLLQPISGNAGEVQIIMDQGKFYQLIFYWQRMLSLADSVRLLKQNLLV